MISSIQKQDVAVFLLAFILFGALISNGVETDIPAHAKFTQAAIASNGEWPANFLYYFAVGGLVGFNSDMGVLLLSSVFLLSLSVAGKFVICRVIFQNYCNRFRESFPALDSILMSVCALLLLVFNLPSNTFYVGQIPSNVWHNSTTIFLMPFAVLLFWVSYRQLHDATTIRIVLITLLCLLNIYIKPSFFFVFCLSYPFFLLLKYGVYKIFWLNIIPVGLGLLFTLSLYLNLYGGGAETSDIESSSVVVHPFSVWASYSSNIVISLLVSLCLPLVYLICYWRDFRNSVLLQYSLSLLILSIVIYSLFSETGIREFHGNFFWQCVVSSFIVFFVVAMLTTEKMLETGVKNVRSILLTLTFLAHVLSGLTYLGLVFYNGSAII